MTASASSWMNLETFSENALVRALLPTLAVSLIAASLAFIFLIVPGEQEMGAVQRIFYFHVGSAMASYGMIAVLLIASSLYLVTGERPWDLLAQSAAGVAFLFCSLVLLTGMIWGHSAWNTWWRWEPRLVSSLVLWLILAGYLIVRSFSAGHARQRNFLSVLGIIAACFVPVVIFSIQLLDKTQQLHPQVVARQGLAHPLYRWCLVFSICAILVCGVWLLVVSFRNRLLEDRLDGLEREISRISFERETANA